MPPKSGLPAAWFSRVFFTEASILARKQSGEVHYVELESKSLRISVMV